MTARVLVGIFVGGRGARMGGAAKGLLRSPEGDLTVIERLLRECAALDGAECVLVGDGTEYATLSQRALPDDPPGQGPLGGLRALLLEGRASERKVLALACDLPYVTATLLAQLATHAPSAAAVAPRDSESGLWNPLFARYAPEECVEVTEALLRNNRRSLQGVFDALGPRGVALPLTREEWPLLRDWDTPEDVRT